MVVRIKISSYEWLGNSRMFWRLGIYPRGHDVVRGHIKLKVEMDDSTTLKGWIERWEAGKTGWHLKDVNKWLIRYGSLLELSTKKRIFVPLCGKSVDLKWFYDSGHTVVGVEGVEKAVKEFFEEHSITYMTQELSYGKLYKSEDARLQIYACDLFDLDSETLGKFDIVWDRGSLVAIFAQDRERYAVLIKSILEQGFRYMLATMQYDGTETAIGPPRCIPHELVTKLFGDVCKQTVLETVDITDDRVRNQWKLEQCEESCLLLVPKNS